MMIILQRRQQQQQQQQSHQLVLLVLILRLWNNLLLFLPPTTTAMIVLLFQLVLCIIGSSFSDSSSVFVAGAITTTTTTKTNITFTIQKNNCLTQNKIQECSSYNRYCHSVLTLIERDGEEGSSELPPPLLSNDMATEICSYCKQGYIEFIGQNTNNTTTTLCRDISTITLDDYLQVYEPYYKPSWDRKLKSDNLMVSIQLIDNYYNMNIPDIMTSTTIIPHTTTDMASTTQMLASSLSTLNKNIEDLLLPTFFFYKLGLTPFSADDIIDEEQRGGYFYVNFTSYSMKLFPKVSTPTIANADLPVSVDWRNQPDTILATSPVINQGRCACSWATSLIGSIEGSAAATATTWTTTEEQYQGPSFPSSSSGTIFDFDSYPQVTSSSSSSEALSIQQLISCNVRNLGCDGGNLVVGMLYASTNTFGGLAFDSDYPFVSGGGGGGSEQQQDLDDGSDGGNVGNNECQLLVVDPPDDADDSTTSPSLAVTIDDPQIAFDYDDDDDDDSAPEEYNYERRLLEIKQVLTNEGPISVVMKSSCKLFSNYVGGILTNDGDCFCNTETCADHAVLLVGFNDIASSSSSSTPYFILKNSWGTNWGENGYFRIAQYPPNNVDVDVDENRHRYYKYGLFGILGFGLLPGTVTNLMVDNDGDNNENTNTNKGGDFGILEGGDSVTQDDGNDDDLPLPIWAFFLIACAGLVVCWCCCECITMLRRKKQHHGHHEQLED